VDWDLQCGTNETKWSYNKLQAALDDGLITESDLDVAVTHVLTQKFAMRLFDRDPSVGVEGLKDLDAPPRRALALTAAEQGIVLLVNRNNTLPITSLLEPAGDGGVDPADPTNSTAKKAPTKIALIGPAASSEAGAAAADSLMGPYTLSGANVTTLDLALEAADPTGRAMQVTWAEGCKADGASDAGAEMIPAAVALAEESDVAILILGDSGRTCGEWQDRDSLDLPGGQLALLNAVADVAKRTIVILVHGRQATFGTDANRSATLLSKVDAMFAAWRPGEEAGTALVNLITGATNPSAKLAQSWPRVVGQVHSGSSPWLQTVRGKWVSNNRGKADADGRHYDNYVSDFDPTPLFYFGYGLSYSTFEYSGLTVSVLPALASADDANEAVVPLSDLRDADNKAVATVAVTIKNTGHVPGTEIVQVYVTDPRGLPFVPFWKRLAGFGRAEDLPAGAVRTLTIELEWQDLAMHDNDMVLRIFPGEYTISVGGASNDDKLSAALDLS
jgi:beta-glucosidase